MELKILNNTQKEEVAKLFGFYKYFYICNSCGSVYGADFLETRQRHCPICESKINLKNADKKKKKKVKKKR